MEEEAQEGDQFSRRGTDQKQWSGSKGAGNKGPSGTSKRPGEQMNPKWSGVKWHKVG